MSLMLEFRDPWKWIFRNSIGPTVKYLLVNIGDHCHDYNSVMEYSVTVKGVVTVCILQAIGTDTSNLTKTKNINSDQNKVYCIISLVTH